MVTPGAKPIMFYTILAMVEEGDEVLYPIPGSDLRIDDRLCGRHPGSVPAEGIERIPD